MTLAQILTAALMVKIPADGAATIVTPLQVQVAPLHHRVAVPGVTVSDRWLARARRTAQTPTRARLWVEGF